MIDNVKKVFRYFDFVAHSPQPELSTIHLTYYVYIHVTPRGSTSILLTLAKLPFTLICIKLKHQ